MIPAEDIKTLLLEMDDDGDGKIDYGVSLYRFLIDSVSSINVYIIVIKEESLIVVLQEIDFISIYARSL